MGADIYSFAEVKVNNKWEEVRDAIFPKDTINGTNPKQTEPFNWRNYNMFSFLGGVRNTKNINSIGEIKGLPFDSIKLNRKLPNKSTYGIQEIITYRDDIVNCGMYHGFSYLTLEELLAFDYNQLSYSIYTYTDMLGEKYFETIEILKTLGDPNEVRVVFYFD